MSDKQPKNQKLRTVDLVGMVVLFGLVSAVIGAVLAEALHDIRPTRAKAMAEAWAMQLEDAQRSFSGSRHPASLDVKSARSSDVGRIGRDPWGAPFHYIVVRDDVGVQLVAVWSEGPNGKNETQVERLLTEKLKAQEFVLGDDIAEIRSAASVR